MYGDHDLVTPTDQLRAWNNTINVYNTRRGQPIATKVDGLFWALQTFVSVIYAMFVVALIKSGQGLVRLHRDRRA